MNKKTILIIGSGAWGTALAVVGSSCGHKVLIKTRQISTYNEINNHHTNTKALPNIKLKTDIKAIMELPTEVDIIIFAVPSTSLACSVKETLAKIKNKPEIVIATKGIYTEGPQLFSSYFEKELNIKPIFLGGPTFAQEVASQIPSACNIGCSNFQKAQEMASYLNSPNFHAKPISDVISMQISGCYKNILAIYCGYISALNLGDNFKAKICTESLSELKFIIDNLSGEAENCYSYCGLGDIILSCFSEKSRNFKYGMQLAQNIPIKKPSCVEGISAAKNLAKLCFPFYKELTILPKIANLISEFEEKLCTS